MRKTVLKILTDENISPKVVAFFRQQGVNVLDTKEEGWHGKEDAVLLDIAYQEQRFVLTYDSDFGTLAINQGKRYYGIIYLRLKNSYPTNVIRVCQQIFTRHIEWQAGTLIVVEESRLRVRRPDWN